MCPQVGIFPWSRPMPHNHASIDMGGYVSHRDLLYVPYVNVLAEGVIGNNIADDTVAIQAILTNAPVGTKIVFPTPPDRYRITGNLTLLKRLSLVGYGTRIIIYKEGAGNILTIGEAGSSLSEIYMENFHLFGEVASNDALHLNRVQRSNFKSIVMTGVGNAALSLNGCLLSNFQDIVASTNIAIPGYPVVNFKYGVELDVLDAIDSNGNTFYGFVAEGVTVAPGIGVHFVDGQRNNFIGGGSEGNTVGIQHEAGELSPQNFIGFWLEANGTNYIGAVMKINALGCYGFPDTISRQIDFAHTQGILFRDAYNIRFSDASPIANLEEYERGSRIYRMAPVASATPGWVCVSRVDTLIRVQANPPDVLIDVDSTVGMNVGDRIEIVLDDDSDHRTTIGVVTDADTVQISAPIPAGRFAPVGNAVYTSLWKTMASLGA